MNVGNLKWLQGGKQLHIACPWATKVSNVVVWQVTSCPNLSPCLVLSRKWEWKTGIMVIFWSSPSQFSTCPILDHCPHSFRCYSSVFSGPDSHIVSYLQLCLLWKCCCHHLSETASHGWDYIKTNLTFQQISLPLSALKDKTPFAHHLNLIIQDCVHLPLLLLAVDCSLFRCSFCS